MSTNYHDDIKRFQPAPDDRAVAAIVKHLGIALKSSDASMVSCSSKDELTRIRERWLKKKLALTASDAELDKAIADVCAKMKGEGKKHRVTFYYLLAEQFGKISVLAG